MLFRSVSQSRYIASDPRGSLYLNTRNMDAIFKWHELLLAGAEAPEAIPSLLPQYLIYRREKLGRDFTDAQLKVLAGFPFMGFWSHFGLKLLFSSKNYWVTSGAALFSLVSYSLAILGSATSPNGKAFTSWAGTSAAFILKMLDLPLLIICVSLPIVTGKQIGRAHV